MSLDILYLRAGGSGWGPVDELAALTARLVDGRLLTVEDRGEVSPARKLLGQLPRHRAGRRSLLVLASNPAHLAYAARLSHWLPGYRRTAAWVIDSFWSDRISRMARHRGHFDRVFITDEDLREEWERATGAEVHWAPWGTDTLAIADLPAERPVDVLRIGRQPAAWDDDGRTKAAASAAGLTFEGRPPMDPHPVVNQRNVRAALLRAKFVLAFSNRVSPAPYTHPSREYLTGRWTDALGAGATVAGVAPASAGRTLWPGATVEIDPSDLEHGMEQLRTAVDDWSRSRPGLQHASARTALDWRWRIQDIADALDITTTQVLRDEIALVGRTGGAR
jgi:hypothetical protein